MTTTNENQEEKKAVKTAAQVDLASFDWDAYEHDSGIYTE